MSTPGTETPNTSGTPASAGDFYAEVPNESGVQTETPVKTEEEKPQATLTTGLQPDANKPAEAKPEEVKSADGKPAAKTEGQAGQEIKLTAPEKYLLDPARVDDVVAFAKENGLTQAAAEKLLARENELVAQHILKEHNEHLEEVKGWIDTVTTDKELGGDNLKQSVMYAHATIKQFASESLIQELNETGYGNHPELVRMLNRIGRAMGPDILVKAGLVEGSKPQVDDADLFYGKTTKE